MKRIVAMVVMLFLAGCVTEVYSQSFLKSLGEKAKEAAKRSVERNVENAVDRAVDGAFDKGEDVVKGKGKKKKGNNNSSYEQQQPAAPVQQPEVVAEVPAQQPAPAPQVKQSLEMTYAKSDFVPGDEIIFEDDLAGEQLGEFPSKWDLERGTAEIAKVGGENAIAMIGDSWIKPLMTDNSRSYLGDVFTVEYDVLQDGQGSTMEIDFMAPDEARDNELYQLDYNLWYDKPTVYVSYVKNGEESNRQKEGSAAAENILLRDGQWHHFAISFNKRALKVYVDGIRIINIPNAKAGAGWMTFWRQSYENPTYIKNVRIAKGAVPLYDRMMTDGKIITYGITFDVGKATIKPESMGEINRIVQLMTENPDLKFSVEGHTDSTGNATSNQTLSEQRSQAIVAKLVEMGIAADRLTAVGKGQNSPIADNSTDEGRAKNRRVEFVKQ